MSAEMATGLLFNKGAFLKRVEIILGRRTRLSRLSLLAFTGTAFAVVISLLLSLSVPLRIASLERESQAQEPPVPSLKTDLASQDFGIWNKPLRHYQIGGVPREAIPAIDLSALDHDVWIRPADLGFGPDDSPEEIFEKAGKGDVCVPETDVLLTLRGTRMAPLEIPGQIRPMEPFESRLKRMSRREILDQIRAHLSTHSQDRNDRFKVVPDTHYALLRPDGLLVALEIFGPSGDLSGKFVPLGYTDKASKDGVFSLKESSVNSRLQFRMVSPEEGRDDKTETFVFAPEGREAKTIYLFKEVLFDESDIASCEEKSNQKWNYLELTLKGEAKERFARITEKNIGRQLAIVFDGKVFVIPIIKDRIDSGIALIPSDGMSAEFKEIRNVIQRDKSGETPVIITGRDQSLQGMVTGEDGRPLEGVKIVNWFPFGSNPQESFTNPGGIYYFKTRMGYVVQAYKENYAPAFEEFRERYNRVDEKKDPMFANITMNKGGIVKGRILDKSSGKPLQGARVLVDRKARDPHVGNLPYDIWTSERVVTDKKGRFRMELVPTGLVKIRAEADGYKSEESSYLELEKGKTKSFEISLEKMTSEEIRAEKSEKEKQEKRDLSLSGVVKDSSGKSLDGVKISNFFPNGSMPQETFTNARGEFRFDRERGYVVVADRKDYASSFHEFREKYYEIRRTGQEPLMVEIILTPGGMVEGSIRSEEDGKPIPNAGVWLDRWAKDLDVGLNRYIVWTGEPVKADAEGRFRIDHAPEGALRLHARAEGWAENISPEFSVGNRENKTVNLDLYKGMDIQVQVLDKDNEKPVREAEVGISQLGSRATDKDGICVFHNVPLGSYRLQCRGQSHHELTGEEITIDQKKGEKKVRILLAPISIP